MLQRAASELGAGPMVVDVLASRLGAAHSAPLLPTNTYSQHVDALPPQLAAYSLTAGKHMEGVDGQRLGLPPCAVLGASKAVGGDCKTTGLGLARRGAGAAQRLR